MANLNESGARPKVIIYHAEGRRSERVAWLMEELDLPYELAFRPGDLMGSAMLARAAHPMGVTPTVQVDDDVLVESGAILELITARWGAGRMWPALSSPDLPRHLMWMYYSEGSAAARIIDDFFFHTIPAEHLSPVVARKVGDTARVLDMVEAHLAVHPYFGGVEFTAADIMMHFPIRLTRDWGVDWSLYPHIGPWFERVGGRPAYQRMKARAGTPPAMAGQVSQPLLAATGKA